MASIRVCTRRGLQMGAMLQMSANRHGGMAAMNSLGAILTALLVCTSCDVSDVLGSKDKPDFRNKDWVEVSIKYWVSTRTNKLERVFAVTNASIIADIKNRMNIKKVSGLSIGVDDQLVFRERAGETWQGNVVFEESIYVCKAADKRYSYKLDLADHRLFQLLVNLCVTNEIRYHPEATSKSIILRRNLGIDYLPVE